MTGRKHKKGRASLAGLVAFIRSKRNRRTGPYTAASLFSGAGFSDLGYEQAGFRLVVLAEMDENRAALAAENFSGAAIVRGDLRRTWREVVRRYKKACNQRLGLLIATPPCQGMSSSNPARGKVADPNSGNRRAKERNLLILPVAKVVQALQPRVVVIENVPQLLMRTVRLGKTRRARNIVDVFLERVPEYRAFKGVVQMADYGIPQIRRRSVVVLVRKRESALKFLERQDALPWPRSTHLADPLNGELAWVTLRDWLRRMKYPSLDAISPEMARHPKNPLHRVPYYADHRYSWVADIPPESGANAYQNSCCHSCRHRKVPEGLAYCNRCGAPMLNRPHVRLPNSRIRLVKGFLSSYRRMNPNLPARTITTASSHLGSDFTIHPWENRLLSTLECADLQTIPRTYNWTWALNRRLNYMMRQVVGEAMPPFFTYLHGKVLRSLLSGRVPEKIPLAKARCDAKI